ncbi:MAG: Gfo/Idh/MocA family protein [bacterium]
MNGAKQQISRRGFFKHSAAAGAFMIASPRILGRAGYAAPNDKLNIAAIGVGGRAEENLKQCSSESYIAFCDVDDTRAAKSFNRYERVPKYKDYRVMLDKHENEIDAVIISTPDHTHAVATLDAIRRGKHVYVEKPLAHSIYEVRTLMQAAKEQNVITQLGNQGHSYNDIRRICEWIWDGAIGPVTEVHAWYRNPYGDGKPLPNETPPVPDTLDWDLWLGPAKYRPYHPAYVPGKWRSWKAFGTGVLGDWVCHILDPAFWALKLQAPESVLAANGGEYSPERFPTESVIEWNFPAREEMPPVRVTWTYGRQTDLPQLKDVKLDDWNQSAGALLVGEKGCIVHGSHGGGNARIIPESRAQEVKQPEETIPRVKGNHQQDWIHAIRENRPAGSNFNYGGPLTEVALLGVIATVHDGELLEWDATGSRFKNPAQANDLIKPEFREGWKI